MLNFIFVLFHISCDTDHSFQPYQSSQTNELSHPNEVDQKAADQTSEPFSSNVGSNSNDDDNNFDKTFNLFLEEELDSDNDEIISEPQEAQLISDMWNTLEYSETAENVMELPYVYLYFKT